MKTTSGGAPPGPALAEAAARIAEGTLAPPVTTSFPFSRAGEAHSVSQDGHVRGKLVLIPD